MPASRSARCDDGHENGGAQLPLPLPSTWRQNTDIVIAERLSASCPNRLVHEIGRVIKRQGGGGDE